MIDDVPISLCSSKSQASREEPTVALKANLNQNGIWASRRRMADNEEFINTTPGSRQLNILNPHLQRSPLKGNYQSL